MAHLHGFLCPSMSTELLLRALLRLVLLLQGTGADLGLLAYFIVESPTGQVTFLDTAVGPHFEVYRVREELGAAVLKIILRKTEDQVGAVFPSILPHIAFFLATAGQVRFKR